MVLLNIILVLLLLSLMIIVHEFGHWIVARKLGFQTPVFGFGLPFGGHITLGNWKDTEFRFHWFVLGGYVAIPELGDESSDEMLEDLPNLKPLQTFPIWKRAMVAAAGVTFNIIFAYLMCLIMVATIGPPSPNKQVVITEVLGSKKEANIYNTGVNPIAKNAGLKSGDIVLSINEKPIKNPNQVVFEIKKNKLKEVTIRVKRFKVKDAKKTYKLLNIKVTPNEEGRIGIGIGLGKTGEYQKPSRNPFVWFIQAAQVLLEWTISMLIGLWLMIISLFGLTPSGSPKVGAEDLHGILAIVSVFAQAITIDFREIYRWSALISVNLAIINLLPIPALDGGHLLFMLIEKIRGKKLADAIQQKAIQVGFVFLIALMFFVIFNDVRGLISGKFDMMNESSKQSDKDN